MFTNYSLPGFYLILFLLLCVLVRLLWENRAHSSRLKSIKYRVHVNGTRGKSSVSRLIAAGLRSGGITTFCKMTGTTASLFILMEVKSLFSGWQVGVVKKAAQCNADNYSRSLLSQCSDVAGKGERVIAEKEGGCRVGFCR